MKPCIRSLTCVALIAACSSGDVTGPPPPPLPPVTPFVVGMKINGASFVTDSVPSPALFLDFAFTAFGSAGGTDYRIGLSMQRIRGTGTYPMLLNTTTSSSLGVSTLSSTGSWTTTGTCTTQESAGFITVTAHEHVQSSFFDYRIVHIAGVFGCRTAPFYPSGTVFNITEGHFDFTAP